MFKAAVLSQEPEKFERERLTPIYDIIGPYSEMSINERYFLNGIIRALKPRKIIFSRLLRERRIDILKNYPAFLLMRNSPNLLINGKFSEAVMSRVLLSRLAEILI